MAVMSAHRHVSESEARRQKSNEEQTDCVVPAPLDRLGRVGLWIRSRLLASSLSGTAILLTIQNRRTPAVTTVMKAVSYLGEEDFCLAVFCLLMWVLESRMAFLFLTLMCLNWYVGGLLKNAIRLPRPSVPPVQPLRILQDWSYPSQHSIDGVALPWFLYFYTSEQWHVSALAQRLFFLAVCVWSCVLMFNRLYLGVHSPVDVLTGGFLGGVVLGLFLQVDSVIIPFIVELNVVWLLLFVVVLVIVHPGSGLPNNTKQGSAGGLACWLGFAFSLNQSGQHSLTGALLEAPISEEGTSLFFVIGVSLARLVLGLVLFEVLGRIVNVVLQQMFTLLPRVLFGRALYQSSKVKKSNVFYNRKTYRLPGDQKVFLLSWPTTTHVNPT